MKRATDIASLVLRISASLALFAVAFLALQTRENENHLVEGYDSIAQHAVNVEQDLDDTVKDIHADERQLQVREIVHDFRLTLDNANKAAVDERIYFEQEVPGLMARVNMVVDQAGETLAAYQKTGEALTVAAAGLQPVEDNAALAIAQIDNLVADPNIKATLANIAATSAATADSAKHVDGTLALVHEEADKIVHPPKKKLGFWGSIYAGAQIIHKFEPPLF